MDPAAMIPHGRALLAYSNGEVDARLTIRREDGLEVSLPVSHFFRSPAEFTPIEIQALERCQGHILDVGAGTGLHSLVLASRGHAVTAIDISPRAVEIMAARGVGDARCADVFDFQGGPFDTLLMLGHGIGIVEDLPGLDRFLEHARGLTRVGGLLLLDSLDARRTDDPAHLAYQEANRTAGRYLGATRVQFEYTGEAGPYCGWLHIDPSTLREHSEVAGWSCEILLEEESGDYLACLTCHKPGRIES